jgi:hypothetical protein
LNTNKHPLVDFIEEVSGLYMYKDLWKDTKLRLNRILILSEFIIHDFTYLFGFFRNIRLS